MRNFEKLFLVALCIGIAFADIYNANLDGRNNRTRTNSPAYGVLWMNYTSTTRLDLRVVSTLTNISSVMIKWPPATVNETIFAWQATGEIFVPPQSLVFNITSAQEAQLVAKNWTIYIATPSFPNGEISGAVTLTFATVKVKPLPPINWKTWVVLTMLILMLIALMFDIFDAYFCVCFTVVFFMFAQIITMSETLEGFANSSVMTVGILFVVVEPIQKSFTMKFLSRIIFGRSATTWYWQAFSLLKVLCLVSFISIFLNNTPIVSMFTPIIKNWCRSTDIAPSKFLIPMDYAVIAGGLGSQIGTSTTVLVNGFMGQYGIKSMEFWEIGYLGLPMIVITIVYIVLIGQWCLPNNKGGLFRLIREKGKKFLTDLVIIPKSKLIGKSRSQVEKLLNVNLEIIEIIRDVKLHKKESPTPSPSSKGPVGEQESLPEENKIDPSSFPLQQPQIDHIGESQTLVDKDLSSIIHILPVLPTEIILEGDQLILAGDVDSIVSLHTKQDVLSWVNVNTKFDVKDMIGKSTLKQEDLKTLDNPIAFENVINSEKEAPSVVISPNFEVTYPKPEPTLKERFMSLKDKLNLPEKLRKQQEELEKNEPEFFELVISGENPFIGKKIGESNFREKYESAVLAVRQKTDITKNLEEIVINEGDTVLVLSKHYFYEKWIDERDFYVISRLNVEDENISNYNIRLGKYNFNIWWYEFLSFPIFITMIVLASAGVFDMLRSAMGAACLMIFLRLLTPDQAVRAIPFKLMILMAASIALGTAIYDSGLGTAFGLLVQASNIPPILLPAMIFVAVVLTAAVVHKEGVVSIWFPLCVGVAKTLEISPRPFAFAIAIAASCTFLTPFSYQCNVIVSGPGGYRFWDFTIIGAGLCLLYSIFCGILLPVVWPV